MHSSPQRLFICGLDERTGYHSRNISHLISVANPGAGQPKPAWFQGAHLPLCFGDVVSEADARRLNTSAPSRADIQHAVEFFRAAWAGDNSRILVTCDYGASRSPALAYLFLADQLGAGQEDKAFQLMLALRPDAVPNGLVVRLGDLLLGRHGALLKPLKQLYAQMNAELFPSAR